MSSGEDGRPLRGSRACSPSGISARTEISVLEMSPTSREDGAGGVAPGRMSGMRHRATPKVRGPYCTAQLKTFFPEQALFYFLRREHPNAVNRFGYQGSGEGATICAGSTYSLCSDQQIW